MHKRLTFLILALFFLVLVPRAACADGGGAVGAMNRVDEVMQYLLQQHISAPDADQLADGAIQGMLDVLGDPYTEYFSPRQLADFTGALDGEFIGIGVEVEATSSYPRVSGIIDGSPAQRAGVEKGDLIIAVDGQSTQGMPLADVVDKIRGPEGSVVTITLRRGGSKDFALTVQREELNVPTVQGQVIQGKTGYIIVHSFGTRTADEFGAALDGLKARGITGLVVDLRDNPGGYLQAAVDVAGYFLPPGKTVVTLVDHAGKKEVYRASGDGAASGIPVVLLVNGMSASSAEVLAGALQDYRAAKLVGEQTYGKGVVQDIIPLESGGALKLTVARYYTPAGRCIDGTGLTPDRAVSIPQLQLAAACQELQPGVPVRIIFNNNGVQVDGEKIDGSFAPIYRAGGLWLPLRFTLEALGYQVAWEPMERNIVAAGPAGRLVLPLGAGKAALNDHPLGPAGPVITAPGSGGTYLSVSLLQAAGVRVAEHGKEIIVQGSRKMVN